MHLFEEPGPDNTAAVVEIAIAAARAKNINQIVIASSSGKVAQAFLPFAKEFHIVNVGVAYYIRPEVPNSMSDEIQATLREGGMKLYFGGHVLSGAERGLSTRFKGVYPVEVMAHTLRMFGAGTKVCVECAVEALDAGLITPSPTICVGGSGGGADTAAILTPAGSMRILDTKIHEILCKPGFYEV